MQIRFLVAITLILYVLNYIQSKPVRYIATECPAREENESAFLYNMQLTQEMEHCRIIEKSEGMTIKLRKVKPNDLKNMSELQSDADDEERSEPDTK